MTGNTAIWHVCPYLLRCRRLAKARSFRHCWLTSRTHKQAGASHMTDNTAILHI